ncbi:putative set domain-containing protein 5 protein [Botrytis fragariae]|uniref:Putative set domain-containing protein 5 protein n=1 Tax=Botrytis fragariae TaxID=1964551 RepID=A0A8H6EMF0_9HELO|nr:putative set domain-containing protein 5 protein [Botrytis fragariae]KAF5877245.1 putative set domain-containing protein 5 protein [Botrytis fragariae]
MASDDEVGLFIEACRINHACDNNASSNWNTNIQKHTIHAPRDIQEGKEITISYLGSRSWPCEIRRQVLQEKFKFLCSYNLCALSAGQSRHIDRELMDIARIMTLIPGTFMRYPLRGVRFMDQAVQLLSGKKLGVSLLGGLFVEASKMNIGHGDLARARILAEKATTYLIISYGSDSLQVLDNQHRANHLSMNIYYGLSSLDWATPVHDVPSSLDSNGFEDWLWRREGLQNSQIYFQSPNNLAILVKDIDDTNVELLLETNARGIFPRLRKAHLVAILYAQRDGKITEPEISLENVALLQIFPISLSHLIALRDLTREFSSKRETDNPEHAMDVESQIRSEQTNSLGHADPKVDGPNECITMADQMYAKRDVPGKGLGLIATINIPRGTRILSESALMLGPELIGDDFRSCISKQWPTLSHQQRQDYVSFGPAQPYTNDFERLCAIFNTNCLPLKGASILEEETSNTGGSQTRDRRGGFFLDACRINHACDRNAGAHWIESSQKIAITALKDICKDEEITMNYLGLNKPRRARRASLQEKFGFDCLCGLCSLPTKESKNSDRQLSEIPKLTLFVFGRIAASRRARPLLELREFDQLVRLHNEQETGIADMGRIYVAIAETVLKYRDLARGKVFAERAISDFEIVYGSDCMEIQKWGYLVDNPTEYELFGHSTTWKTTVDEIPTGLSPDKFEDWLWKRGRVRSVERIVDFRSRSIFPPIVHLPFSSNSDYYETNEVSCSRPRNHWCFFGEITYTTKFGNSSLAVKDVDGKEIKLAFGTEERGRELPPNRVKVGYTVAIINAKPHEFPIEDENFGRKMGILHDDELYLHAFSQRAIRVKRSNPSVFNRNEWSKNVSWMSEKISLAV